MKIQCLSFLFGCDHLLHLVSPPHHCKPEEVPPAQYMPLPDFPGMPPLVHWEADNASTWADCRLEQQTIHATRSAQGLVVDLIDDDETLAPGVIDLGIE